MAHRWADLPHALLTVLFRDDEADPQAESRFLHPNEDPPRLPSESSQVSQPRVASSASAKMLPACPYTVLKRIIEFADWSGLEIRLVYYPPYHSKYNPIERCWGALGKKWNGALLTSLNVVLWISTAQ